MSAVQHSRNKPRIVPLRTGRFLKWNYVVPAEQEQAS